MEENMCDGGIVRPFDQFGLLRGALIDEDAQSKVGRIIRHLLFDIGDRAVIVIHGGEDLRVLKDFVVLARNVLR